MIRMPPSPPDPRGNDRPQIAPPHHVLPEGREGGGELEGTPLPPRSFGPNATPSAAPRPDTPNEGVPWDRRTKRSRRPRWTSNGVCRVAIDAAATSLVELAALSKQPRNRALCAEVAIERWETNPRAVCELLNSLLSVDDAYRPEVCKSIFTELLRHGHEPQAKQFWQRKALTSESVWLPPRSPFPFNPASELSRAQLCTSVLIRLGRHPDDDAIERLLNVTDKGFVVTDHAQIIGKKRGWRRQPNDMPRGAGRVFFTLCATAKYNDELRVAKKLWQTGTIDHDVLALTVWHHYLSPKEYFEFLEAHRPEDADVAFQLCSCFGNRELAERLWLEGRVSKAALLHTWELLDKRGEDPNHVDPWLQTLIHTRPSRRH